MSAAEPIYIPRKIWTRAEVDSRSWDGLSLELIEGDLIDRMGKKPPHMMWKNVVRNWLQTLLGISFVQTEDSIDVSPEDNPRSEPEPDIAVTFESMGKSDGENAQPNNLRLVVEISDSSYYLDVKIKARLYARANIREYWLVDVRKPESPRLLRHLNPKDGQYTVSTHSFDEQIELLPGHIASLKDLRQKYKES